MYNPAVLSQQLLIEDQEIGKDANIAKEPINTIERNIGYDPHQKPANIELAIKHGVAKRVYKFISKKNYSGTLCPCCGLPQNGGELLPLCCDTSDFGHLGSGYVLYFSFFKFCVGILCCILLTVGIYSLKTNYQGNQCTSNENSVKSCTPTLINQLSLGNKLDPEFTELIIGQFVFGAVTLIVIMFCIGTMRIATRSIASKIEQKKISCSDYTVMITKLPKDSKHPLSTDEGLISWITSFSNRTITFEVKKIVRSYDLSEFYRIKENIAQLLKKKDKPNTAPEQIREIDLEINRLTNKLQDINTQEFKLNGVVFVSFATVEQANSFIKASHNGILRRIYHFLRSHWHPVERDSIMYYTQRVRVKKAYEPNDINWEHLGHSNKKKYLRRVLAWILTIVIGWLAVCILFTLKLIQNKIQEKGNAATGFEKYLSWFIKNLCVIIIVALEQLIEAIILGLTRKELYSRKSYYTSRAASRIGVITFYSTTLTTLLATLCVGLVDVYQETGRFESFSLMETVYGPSGVINILDDVFIFKGLKNLALTYLSPGYISKLYLQYRAKKMQGSNLTQEEANKLFEGDNMAMEIRYGRLLSMMYMTAFFTPIFPLALPISIFFLVLKYWIDKYIFLRRAQLPPYLGSDIQNSMILLLESITFWYAMGNAFAFFSIPFWRNGEMLLAFWFFVLFALPSMVIFNVCPSCLCCGYRKNKQVAQDYDTIRHQFFSDYDIENPITRDQAIRKQCNSILEYKNKDKTLDDIDEMKTKSQTSAENNFNKAV